MKPITPDLEPKPSIQPRKAVTRGFLNLLMIAAVAVASLGLPQAVRAANIALVVNGTISQTFDVGWSNRLASQGHAVTAVNQTTPPGDVIAANYDLIIVSSHVGSGTFLSGVGMNIGKPYIIYEEQLFDEFFGGGVGTAAGTSITIVNSAHPLAAGLSAGPVTIGGSANIPYSTSTRSANVTVIAHNGNTAQATLMVLEADVSNGSRTFPARIIGIPFYATRTFSAVTANGLAILDAAVAYAFAPPPVSPFDHFTVTPSVTSANAGDVFNVTITGQDASDNTVIDSVSFVSIGSPTANNLMEFDWNSDGTFGDSLGTLVNGVKTIQARNKRAQTVDLVASYLTSTTTTPPSVTTTAGAFAKLRILAPGENAASGTGTGKTGTPTVRTVGQSFDVTVSAVDQYWNVVDTVSDTVAISSTDGAAALPADAPLAAGTGVFNVTLGTVGSFTVTATDVTDGTKTASTTPALTVLGVPMAWVGDFVANLWNTTSLNWFNPSSELVAFTNNNQVTFNDSGSTTPAVDIVGTVLPNTITVNNGLGIDYTLGSTSGGSIGGTGTLTKTGAGSLTLTTPNTFLGTTIINGGTIVVSNNLALQYSPVQFVQNINNAMQLADGITNLIIGGLVKSGSESPILLWINNYSNLTTLTLNVDASKTISYSDIINNTTNAGSPGLTLVKTGAGWQGLSAAHGYTGATEIRDGTLALASTFGGRLNGATVVILGSGANSGILQMGSVGGAQPGTTVGGLTTSGTGTSNAVVGGAPALSSFAVSSTSDWTYAGTFGGPGTYQNNLNVTKSGSGKLTLLGSSTHVGTTTVSGGTLLVNNTTGSGTGSGTVAVNSGGTLGGTGSVSGAVTVNANGTLAPGNSAIGTLTLGVPPTLNGTVVVEINTTQSPSNDVINVTSGTPTAGGSLVVTNLPGSTLALGNSFKLFSAPVSGSFSSIVLPEPPTGTVWTNQLAQNGTIALVAVPAPSPTNMTFSVSGGDLILNWPAGQGWQLQAQTNTLAVGITTNWVTVPGAVQPFTNAVAPANGSVFYRLVY